MLAGVRHMLVLLLLTACGPKAGDPCPIKNPVTCACSAFGQGQRCACTDSSCSGIDLMRVCASNAGAAGAGVLADVRCTGCSNDGDGGTVCGGI
jgi:hypothetical protein